MMCTRTIATGAGITGSADCPPAFPRSSSLVPLGLWYCAVSSPAAAAADSAEAVQLPPLPSRPRGPPSAEVSAAATAAGAAVVGCLMSADVMLIE